MSEFKCTFCSRIFAKYNGLSKHIKICDSELSDKKILFKDIKFCKSSKVVKDIQFNSNSNLVSTLASPLYVSNTDELASGFDKEIDQKYEEFSNKAYANLMGLVTKYKLSNAARNAIISFFNKHSKHLTSPLPKILDKKKSL
ncbi:hypothetical protein F8M41_001515 [Gigaspora margarita]|uniref:C2H2-type domain-containing protein n=1 Tax=Gigaspora margarita TaxID=4874 RepID=A0A8H4A9Z1_GIGMA|nr:hypothetical protein F8M41_001515 [Gigaspora margarita]